MNNRSSIVTGAVLVLLAATCALARAGTLTVPLAYRMPAGDGFALNLAFEAEVPTQGHQAGTANTRSRVETVLEDGLRLHVDVNTPAPGAAAYALAMGVDLSPAGNASNITGVDMANEKDAMVARNIASVGVPALPDAPVQVGSAWESERPVYLPQAPFPGVPSVIRVRFTYTVQGFIQEGSREVAIIGVIGKHPAGQSVKVQATGQWVVETATGKPLRAHIEGVASLRVVFTDLKLPFKVDAAVPLLRQFANR